MRAQKKHTDVKPGADLDIGEVARRAGVRASALRFYEEKGLIASTGRRGLRRTFDVRVLDRLALIRLGRAAGLSLEVIAEMFAPDGRLRVDRERLLARADAIDRTIRRLVTMRDGLRHAAACPARSHLECPKFRRIVRLAASGRLDENGATRKRPDSRREPGLASHVGRRQPSVG